MASGDKLDEFSHLLLDSVVATADGVWVEAKKMGKSSVVVQGITTATVKIRGSNDKTVPANTTHGVQLGSDVTADGKVEIAAPYRWIKAQVTAYTSGTIIAILHGAP